MTAPASPHPPARAVRFVASATVSQVASYFVVGLVASRVLDYSDLLARPVVRDYYLPTGR